MFEFFGLAVANTEAVILHRLSFFKNLEEVQISTQSALEMARGAYLGCDCIKYL
jgi:hypothetical protein